MNFQNEPKFIISFYKIITVLIFSVRILNVCYKIVQNFTRKVPHRTNTRQPRWKIARAIFLRINNHDRRNFRLRNYSFANNSHWKSRANRAECFRGKQKTRKWRDHPILIVLAASLTMNYRRNWSITTTGFDWSGLWQPRDR